MLQMLLCFGGIASGAVKPLYWEDVCHPVCKSTRSPIITSPVVNDCSFLITKAIPLPGGGYELCLQANEPGNNSWTVTQAGFPPVYLYGTSVCHSFPPGAEVFTIQHETGDSVCRETITIHTTDRCFVDIISASTEDCALNSTVFIDVTNINLPYTITFGDGTPAIESTANQLSHQYPAEGTYQVCITYYLQETRILTCCYEVYIEAPPACSCQDSSLLEVVSVEPCEWIATLDFNLDPDFFPVEVNYGDGTPTEVVDQSLLIHDFPSPGSYQICYSYETIPGDTLTCCETVLIEGCCLDPYFELDQVAPSPSCQNSLYRVSHQACEGTTVRLEHIWIFSDSTRYEGETPPPHLFTNFIDAAGEVCVTHIVKCCNESDTMTVCAPHTPGAYLGYPGQNLNFTDVLPFTGETVLQFLYGYSNWSYPLFIDGRITANTPAFLLGGTWNMGRESEILLTIPNGSGTLIFSGTTLQSTARLGLGGCCRWKGIRVQGDDLLWLSKATITDTQFAVRFVKRNWQGNDYPRFFSQGTSYLNNYFAIRSDYQFVHFLNFKDNFIEGVAHPFICDCVAVNAIDFHNAQPGFTVKITPWFGLGGFGNIIRNYEKAFNFVNTRLYARDFEIIELQDYADADMAQLPFLYNNPEGEAAVGIDFQWTQSGSSLLDFNFFKFQDFVSANALGMGVRYRIQGSGNHRLAAMGQEVAPPSIYMSDVAGGYLIQGGPGSVLDAHIAYNNIHANGGIDYGFGVLANVQSKKNSLRIEHSEFLINSGSDSDMNTGISITSALPKDQDVKILDNYLQILMPVGEAIKLVNVDSFSVRRNIIEGGSAQIPGIQLDLGGNGIVDCNTIKNKRTGIEVNYSRANRYGDNYLRANNRDMTFRGDLRTFNAQTWIKWNTFFGSNLESLHYYHDAVTGQQFHNDYNRWMAQNGVEVIHEGDMNSIIQSRFLTPDLLPPTEMHPYADPEEMFFKDPFNQPPDTLPPAGFCSVTFDNGFSGAEEQITDPLAMWEDVLQDSAFWDGLTPALRTLHEQWIYALTLEDSTLTANSSVFSDFKMAMDNDFTGASEQVRKGMAQLLEAIKMHRQSIEPVRQAWEDAVASADSLLDAIALSDEEQVQDSLRTLLLPLIEQSDSLHAAWRQADSVFWIQAIAILDDLKAQNAALDESWWHYRAEKKVNEILLDALQGSLPDSAARAELRTIAQTCIADGGRAVMLARGLSETWLLEHYDDNGCHALAQRSASAGSGTAPLEETVTVWPNPATRFATVNWSLDSFSSDRIRIELIDARGAVVWHMQVAAHATQARLPLQSLPGGYYLIRLSDGIRYRLVPLIIIH